MQLLLSKHSRMPLCRKRDQIMIQSVTKAINILHAFSPSEPRLALGEIAQRMGLPKSTTHNLLATLVAGGLVERVDDDRYALGPAVIALTLAVRVNVELRDRSAPLLRELADVCRDSVFLTIRDGDSCLYIYAVESSTRLQARTAIGDRSPLHCTAVGKAMLAFMPTEEVAAIAARAGLAGFTENTIRDVARLQEEVAATRQRGYSMDCAEHEPGIYCIGAPIFDATNAIVGACSISGNDPEIVSSRVEELSRHVRYAAQETSRRMGHIPSRPSLVLPPGGINEGFAPPSPLPVFAAQLPGRIR